MYNKKRPWQKSRTENSQDRKSYLRTIRQRKVNCTDHISRRNSMLKQVINGKIEGETEVKGRRGRRRKHILDDIEGMTGHWKLQEAALYSAVWRSCFGRACGHIVMQTAGWWFDDDDDNEYR